MTEFSQLNLAAPVAKAIAAGSYTTPTPIQSQAIPLAMKGHDILGIAQTGTGKTAAFALPILDRIARAPARLQKRGARVLVLAPTRELASQIAASFTTYGANLRVSVATVFGGVPINRQIRQMERGVDILVATPGRLIDLIDRKAIDLGGVETLVLDEADQMLDLGFIHALRQIAPLLPAERQTLFFSATMPKAIAALAAKYLTDPVEVRAAPPASTAERVEQRVMFVSQGDKPALLAHVLKTRGIERALVFTRTKHGADRVVRQLGAVGVDASAIHGNKSQGQRERALKAFRSGRERVLVATDIAARGIDVPGVSHVINFEIPNVPEQYVHRIGRTARAGADGLAISFVCADERAYLRDIERLIRFKVPADDLPEGMGAKEAAPAAKERSDAPGKKSRADDNAAAARNRKRRHRGKNKPGEGSKRVNRNRGAGKAKAAAASA